MAIQEVTATYQGERYRFQNDDGDVIIGGAEHEDGERPVPIEMYGIKGAEDESQPLVPHGTYRFYGRWSEYTNRKTAITEHQFHFDSYTSAEPATKSGVIAYLREIGRGHGIGTSLATAIWQQFGSESVKKLREEPETVAASIPKLRFESALEASAVLVERRHLEHCTVALMGILDRRGFPRTTIRRCISIWGNRAAEIVQRNPYALMRFRGCGFKGTDKLYLDLGHSSSKLKRQALCAWYAIASDTNGHVWYPRAVAFQAVEASVIGQTSNVRKEDAVRLAIRGGMLEEIGIDRAGKITGEKDRIYLAEAKDAKNERFVSRVIVNAEQEHAAWPSVDTLDQISAHQKKHLGRALQGTIGLFGGGPGTGKTFASAALVKSLCHGGHSKLVAIAAPTGKAAVKISEVMAQHGVSQRARTIHSLLGVESAENGWSFRHNEYNPLPYRYILVDECFVHGTRVDTPSGQIEIQNVVAGTEIYNASGIDTVRAVTKREVNHVARITVGQTEIYCSENHRFFTTRGFVSASELKVGDPIIPTTEALRLLRNDATSFPFHPRHKAFLQSIMLDEMVDAVPRIQEAGVHQRASEESRLGKKAIPHVAVTGSNETDRSHQEFESDAQRRMQEEVIRDSSEDRSQAEHSRRKWGWNDDCAASPTPLVEKHRPGRILDTRTDCCDEESARPAQWNQTRHWKSIEEDLHRVRWPVTFNYIGKGEGQSQGFVSLVARVESVEVLKQDDPRLDGFRDQGGRLYLYDIEATRHRTFSVEGLLVHNCSMIDASLMGSLLAARSPMTHILFVGDVNQLPPVGRGAPLRDLIQAGLPYGRLTEIRRNDGGIVQACADIRDGKRFACSGNLIHDFAASPEQQISQCLAVCDRARTMSLNPIWDVQIVVPVNAKSPVCRQSLNKHLQQALNANPGVSGSPFRVGDKIVNTANGFYPLVELGEDHEDAQVDDRGEVYVANGELAEVMEVFGSYTIARLSAPARIVRIGKRKDKSDENGTQSGTGCNWELGYALSVHKSQGSEWPVVGVVLDKYPGARLVMSREWIYTAISRAKTECHLVGEVDTAWQSCRRQQLFERKTFLAEQLDVERASRVLAEL